ncbi:nucleotidyltransferase domain-containing protein [Uliginosibacterium sp. H1]|uniref:nucleotidyltransferase domain-containing protein n=1 Tax=Uliginosibacterium sp. H1 TaxID=3114757 RepID=UPI002E19B4A0|nr:nucleotidyltransferase family protein [Uliginosibacterium sp. H1]
MKVLLLRALREPATTASLSLPQWDLLIRQARHANLLGHLHDLLENATSVPEVARAHLLAGARLAERQQQSVRHEAQELAAALNAVGIRPVLLKGAAYVLADLNAARGRVFADVDLLVPHGQLPQAEAALMLAGWVSGEADAYNQRYYREWMHELPPMQHLQRGSVVDVHHTILPPTSRAHPDPAALVANARALQGWPGLAVLSSADMVLHSAAHLFHEGEGDNALRDLVDLRSLIAEFLAGDADFWHRLVEQAHRHHLCEVLALALRYLDRVLGVAVPAAVTHALSPYAGNMARRLLRDQMYGRIFTPLHSSTKDLLTPLAREALYIRAHWLRMPPGLLAQHLARKAWMRVSDAGEPLQAEQP